MKIEELILEKLISLPDDKKLEVLDFTEFLQSRIKKEAPRRRLKGALADLNIHLTDDDLRQARSDMRQGDAE